eukprot:SAG22_NODE_153_length_17315_cov_69.981935_10_plen_269_part_00
MILVGGPDWPTSVTTGIMKLSVPQMLLGSLPHSFPITLVVFAGSMLMKTADPNPIWAPLSDVFIALASAIYPVLLVIAAGYILETTELRKAEIDAMEEDEAVRILDARKEELETKSKLATAWPQAQPAAYPPVPAGCKLVLVLAYLAAHVSCLIFAGGGSQCFEKVDLLTNTTLPPFNGEPYRVVKDPMGYIANAIWITGIFLGLVVFRAWVASRLAPLRKEATAKKVGVAAVGGPDTWGQLLGAGQRTLDFVFSCWPGTHLAHCHKP